MKKSIEKKTVVRMIRKDVHYTLKQVANNYQECPLLSYREAIDYGCGMSKSKAIELVERLTLSSSRENIGVIVVFFDDPHKNVKEPVKKVKKKAKRK